MTAYSHREVAKALKGKHGFRRDDDGSHIWFEYWHVGKLIASCHYSHQAGGRDVPKFVVSSMARELGISGGQFRQALDCQLNADSLKRLLMESALGGS